MENRERKGMSRVVIKYALLNLPAALLVAAVMIYLEIRRGLPGWLFWGVIGAWVLKDIVLFPLVRRAYEGGVPEYKSLRGEMGTARERLAPEGYIWIHGELWWARLTSDDLSVEPGDSVKVCDVEGLSLLVEPEEKQSA